MCNIYNWAVYKWVEDERLNIRIKYYSLDVEYVKYVALITNVGVVNYIGVLLDIENVQFDHQSTKYYKVE